VALGIGVETVRTHARNIYRKLGVCSRSELLAPVDREPAESTATDAARPRRRVRVGRPRHRRGHDARRP
jgi:hypothetical protein